MHRWQGRLRPPVRGSCPAATTILFAGLVVGTGLFSGGCSVAGEPQPDSRTMTPLAGSEDARCSGDSSFELSPDGRWLLYESRRGDVFDPLFVFFDLERGGRHETTLSSEAAELAREGRGPAFPACWTDGGATVYLTGQRSGFVVEPGRGDFRLLPVSEPPCSPSPSTFEPDEAREANPATAARAVQVSATEARVVAPGGAVLAEHSASGASDHLEIRWLRASPDDRWLAYAVTERRGSFVAPSRGYAVALRPGAGEPIPLVTPVFGPFHWAPDGELYACTGRPDAPASADSGPRVVRWRPGS